MESPDPAVPLQDPNLPQIMCTVPSVTTEELGPQVEAARYVDVPDLPVLFEANSSSKHKFWRGVMFVFGALFTAYGVFGTLVPVLPGVPFLLVGLPMMAASNEYMRRWVNHLERRLPMKLRGLLRKYKPTRPPQGATLEQLRYWRRKTALSALKFMACVATFTGVGYLATWLFKTYA